jgi:hypothetical protein
MRGDGFCLVQNVLLAAISTSWAFIRFTVGADDEADDMLLFRESSGPFRFATVARFSLQRGATGTVISFGSRSSPDGSAKAVRRGAVEVYEMEPNNLS